MQSPHNSGTRNNDLLDVNKAYFRFQASQVKAVGISHLRLQTCKASNIRGLYNTLVHFQGSKAQAPCMTHFCRATPDSVVQPPLEFNVNQPQPDLQAAVAPFLVVPVSPKPFDITRQALFDLRAVADALLEGFALHLPQNHQFAAAASRNHGAAGVPRPQHRRA